MIKDHLFSSGVSLHIFEGPLAVPKVDFDLEGEHDHFSYGKVLVGQVLDLGLVQMPSSDLWTCFGPSH